MPLSVTRRIHVVPLGYEVDRVTLAAIDYEADRVILLAPDEGADSRGARCQEKIEEELSDEGIETEYRECEIFEMHNAVENILEVIREFEADNDVRVNVSAGSKITAISGMLACMFSEAEPYYVKPEGYGEDELAVSHGKDEIMELPAYPVTEPDYQLIQVLDFVSSNQSKKGREGVLLKDISKYLLEHDLPAVEGTDKDPDEAEDIYPIVRENIIDPLENRGLITVTQIKTGKHVRTTSRGEDMLEMGQSLIEQRY
jgi:hypothetical protein